MKWRAWLEKWSMISLKITLPFLKPGWAPKDEDKECARFAVVRLGSCTVAVQFSVKAAIQQPRP